MPEMVYVGTKLPHGLILELVEPADKENFMQVRNPGRQVKLKGACSLYNQSTKKSVSRFEFAITPVEKSFWDAWYARNKDRDYVRNGLVFVTEKEGNAQGIAKERVDVKTGFEPLSQEVDSTGKPADPRMQRAVIDPEYSEPA